MLPLRASLERLDSTCDSARHYVTSKTRSLLTPWFRMPNLRLVLGKEAKAAVKAVASAVDAGLVDISVSDSGSPDAAVSDTGVSDTGVSDTGASDTAASDSTSSDSQPNGDASSSDALSDASVPTDATSATATLAEVQTKVFAISCTFSKCHSAIASAGGLNLTGDTHGRLVNVAAEQAGWKLVVPGSPKDSWLWHKVAVSPPQAGDPMPPQSPLDAERLALIEQWITAGALP